MKENSACLPTCTCFNILSCVHVSVCLYLCIIMYMSDVLFLSPAQGVMVKTDYIPLLQSLAPYGWRLMCVLPTPIVKTNRYKATPQKHSNIVNSITYSKGLITSFLLKAALLLLFCCPRRCPSSFFLGLRLTVCLRYAGQMVRDLTNHDHMLIST